MRDDGSARLSLSYKGARQNGINRISYEISATDLVQLVLFEAAIGLRDALGAHRRGELALDGLVLKYGAGDRDLLSFDRQLGFSSQTAFCPLKEFHAAMAEVTESCLARAETSKHGASLKGSLAQCRIPETLLAGMSPDIADQILYRLREMALLILAEDVASRGSALARELRGRKTQKDAVEMIEAVLLSLVNEFVDDEDFRRDDCARLLEPSEKY
ncbi:hypothetical protein [Antarcticimicrobium sediminis]|uniref:Uncharacterized protein n=1 Tax=Antarcticimicrobium sediminis TaxID=2546227 RepID=A0A4R5EKP0_9RHOB|nr:hypothetical protein [Antarcticimicrobium sediminis]TDE34910.1 hypothetical protein E1B25_18405 [Antarcticimicrobium sediminis]